jgi:hypothetical protein
MRNCALLGSGSGGGILSTQVLEQSPPQNHPSVISRRDTQTDNGLLELGHRDQYRRIPIRALDIEFHFPSAAGVVLDALIVQLLGDPALQSSIQKI